ncbi:phosphate ABC transporter substrate-binding protein [Grimontia hollisae]|uniref:Phosphate-binding protein n=2 Tax=Grimontia hollisae TaxID=673 RepID=D0ICU5_GRIHO|nr:phosphate ABC transporter substrate-binding protein [Grimontia hollisae]AMG30074.1 phosphate ABC transporter substrate-binding protein [Grimontia hollisae]EEY71713.1 phosphate ABC transporter, periplasmic phosphate-binding protein PstS [Grimontia hollisae CIP 101886]STO42725.1 Phosphate-binding protein pstS precursor [Grimontia hollisae]STO56571.1 Phosphate-binding protein pstS precursor [Grimontia hollisae]STQ77377.1 Phosphate-binding protein pstS precursor [Grimontia hollisae]
MLIRALILIGLLLMVPPSLAEDHLPAYHRIENVSGNLSTVGSDTLANLVTQWGSLFKQYYPSVNVQIQTSGSSTAVPALIEATTQFGTMSREMHPREIELFERRYGYPPTAIKVAIDAMAIFVHQDNPIDVLNMRQVDALFSQTLRCGANARIEKWGQLGLSGNWKKRNIQRFGRNSVSGTYGFFKDQALCDGDFRPDVNEQPGSASVVQSVSTSLNAIGYAGIGYRTAGAKMLPLDVDGERVYATTGNVISGRYPLSRYLYVYVNKVPGKPLPRMEAEFIRMILSRQGQALVGAEGFVPLPKNLIEQQLNELDL